ncbi:PAS domain-containing protein [Thalassospiraceae bacterium LMO-SO8]|nr:PAS domain-containing protein [Thalassospiraceae bacterium LMO-SO8]
MAVLIKDSELRLERTNPVYRQWYGIDFASKIGESEILVGGVQADEEDIHYRQAQEREVLKTGEIRTREATHRFADGRDHSLKITKFPIFDDQGKAIRVGSVSIDMTQEVEARRALERHERLLRSLIDNLPVGITMTDSNEYYNLVNQTLRLVWVGPGRRDRQ